MSTQTLSFNVSGSNIEATDIFLAADSINYAVAQFSFDQSWDTLYKTAVFRKGENVYHVVLKNDKCNIPFEVLTDGIMYVSCFGIYNQTRATTIELPIQVQKSGYTICTPSEATPDPYNYFLNEVSSKAAGAEESATKAQGFAETAAAQSEEAHKCLLMINSMIEPMMSVYEDVGRWNLEVSSYRQQAQESKETAVAAAEEARNFADNSLQSIERHNLDTQTSHTDIRSMAKEAIDIAKGKSNSLSFDTEEQLIAWVEGKYTRADKKTTADLNVGDNLYIIELGVPDYWWDGENVQPLGAEKPALLEYVKKEELEAQLSGVVIKETSETEYENAVLNNKIEAGAIYFVYGEEE